ncbi:uncharacterized protein METZ01_LOCUS457162, partial [marine metagenome]
TRVILGTPKNSEVSHDEPQDPFS